MLRKYNKHLLVAEPIPFWEWSFEHNINYQLPKQFLDLPFFFRNQMHLGLSRNPFSFSTLLFGQRFKRSKKLSYLYIYSIFYSTLKRVLYYRTATKILSNFINVWIRSLLNKDLFAVEQLVTMFRRDNVTTRLRYLYSSLRKRVHTTMHLYTYFINQYENTVRKIYRKKIFSIRYNLVYFSNYFGKHLKRFYRVIRTVLDSQVRVLRKPNVFINKFFRELVKFEKRKIRVNTNSLKRMALDANVIKKARLPNSSYITVLEMFLFSRYDMSYNVFLHFLIKYSNYYKDWYSLLYLIENIYANSGYVPGNIKEGMSSNHKHSYIYLYLFLQLQRGTIPERVKQMAVTFFCSHFNIYGSTQYKRRIAIPTALEKYHSVETNLFLQIPHVLKQSDMFSNIINSYYTLQKKYVNGLSLRYNFISELFAMYSNKLTRKNVLRRNTRIKKLIRNWKNYYRILSSKYLRKLSRYKNNKILLQVKKVIISKLLKTSNLCSVNLHRMKRKVANKNILNILSHVRTRASQEVLRYSYAYADYYKDMQYEWISHSDIITKIKKMNLKRYYRNSLGRIKYTQGNAVMQFSNIIYLYEYLSKLLHPNSEIVQYKTFSLKMCNVFPTIAYDILKELQYHRVLDLPENPKKLINTYKYTATSDFISNTIKPNDKLRYNSKHN